MQEQILGALRRTHEASAALYQLTDDRIQRVLNDVAERAVGRIPQLIVENAKDLARMDTADPKYDRLLLNEARIHDIANDLRSVALLPSLLGDVLEARELDNGLALQKVRVPLGVVAVVYESRPNVTFDVFGLCLKTANACVLKGSRDAADSNRFIIQLIQQTLSDHQLNPDVVYLTPPQREALPVILHAADFIDVAIPRGSQGLIDYVRDTAKIPVIETGAGICHTYVDQSADPVKAKAIITNAKTRRVSVCNALDTLIIHQSLLPELSTIVDELGHCHQVTLYADDAAYDHLEGHYPASLERADEQAFGCEYLDYKMSIKTVASADEALSHIRRYSSKHSEAIVTEDQALAERFLAAVDAAAVYVNASTAFTDGAQFGLGAEIGISTQKLHARGPMALAELTSYKWLVRGNGQIRS